MIQVNWLPQKSIVSFKRQLNFVGFFIPYQCFFRLRDQGLENMQVLKM